MTTGPGKYDDECTIVRERTGASAVAIIVIGGTRGHGFSVQCVGREFAALLPDQLEAIAAEMRRDMRGGEA